jgi:hypothetical protein
MRVYEIGENPKTPPETLEKLANDKDFLIRRQVAGNPSTPVEILEKLANDEKWYPRCETAGNPSTPPETLAKLAEDRDSGIREYVAETLTHQLTF